MRGTLWFRAGLWAMLACGAAACDEPTGSQRLRVQAVSGNAQVDTVGAVLAQALVAEVTDHHGEPVAGRTVEFSVISGGGSLQPATALTDAQGRAQVQWTLGTRTSQAELVEARVAQASGRAVPDTFTATVRPGAVVRMEAVSPLRLSGVQGRPLADSVTVRLFDRFDNPAEGRSVRWIMGGPQGSVSPDVAYARADGTARTQWTLSRTDDEQGLSATLPDGSRFIDFAATGSKPPLDVVIELPYPAAYGDTVPIMADTRASANQPAGVTASVEDRSTALRFSEGRWRGSMVLTGLAPGAKVMQAVVSDANGNTDTTHMSFIYDAPPVLTLDEPANGLVVGSYRVRAACQDNDPCTFTVRLGDALVAEVQGSIDQTFSLPAGIADSVRLRLRTQDGYGRVRTAERLLYAINHPDWTLVARLPAPPAGEVIDMDATRLLLRNGAVVTRATGALTQLFPEGLLTNGFLGPHGAIATLRDSLWEWRNGTLIRGRQAYSPLRVDGQWALWQEAFPQAFRYEVGTMVRDLQTGTTEVIDLIPFTEAAREERVDVGPNGDVVVWHRGEQRVARYRNGVRTVLPAVGSARYVRTDGNLIVYISPYYDGGPEEQLRVIDTAGVDRVVGPFTPYPAYGFVVRNGWIAYTRRGAGEAAQAWIVHPDGTQQQLTIGGQNSAGVHLSENGKLVIYGADSPNRVFVPGRGITSVGGPASQRMFWVGDELYGSWGGGLFRIDY